MTLLQSVRAPLISVMKIVSTQKNWPYQETDTAETLLNGVLGNTDLEPFFKQPLMAGCYHRRNRLSSAHGAGIQSVEVRQRAMWRNTRLTFNCGSHIVACRRNSIGVTRLTPRPHPAPD